MKISITFYSAALVLASIVISAIVRLSAYNSIGCDYFDHSPEHFLAYCNSTNFGQYDHAAYLFAMEDGLTKHVSEADLLFLGNSRVQIAFSSPALDAFSEIHPTIRPYLLGFGYAEQDLFSEAVIRQLAPHPKVVVINADPFFARNASPHAANLLGSPGAEKINGIIKRTWARIGQRVCADDQQPHALAPLLCGSAGSIYRDRRNGRWVFKNPIIGTLDTADTTAPEDYYKMDAWVERAQQFLTMLPVKRSCVIFTAIPSPTTKIAVAREMARRLGVAFIDPELSGLKASDQVHLDSASGNRWATAFLSAIEPTLQRCMQE